MAEYRASTDNKKEGQAAASLQENSDYKASSIRNPLGMGTADVASAVPSISNIGSYRAATDITALANEVHQTTLKISLAEIGFWKQVLNYNRRASIPTFDDEVSDEKKKLENNIAAYKTRPELLDINRQDTQNEFVFRCGDYFLPLSFTYTINASKNIAYSQLVDGVEIIQVVNRKPKDITLNIRIERNLQKAQNTSSGRSMSFLNANVPGTAKDNIDGSEIDLEEIKYQITALGVALNDLYERQEVFRVENKTVNTDIGISYALLSDYSYRVNAGATYVDIMMKLHEVNMDENSVVFDRRTVDAESSAGGGAKTIG